MQQNFAASAQRHARWSTDNGERCIFKRGIDLLALFDQITNGEPGAELLGDKQHTDIGTDGEVAALIVDYQRPIPVRYDSDGLLDHPEDQRIEAIHFTVKFQA